MEASQKAGGLKDDGGYLKLNGTSSGSWYKGKGVTAGMTLRDVVKMLGNSAFIRVLAPSAGWVMPVADLRSAEVVSRGGKLVGDAECAVLGELLKARPARVGGAQRRSTRGALRRRTEQQPKGQERARARGVLHCARHLLLGVYLSRCE